ncbi:MAG: type 1 glutamine amidotransferase [Pseudomonadota bacterium]
MKTLTIIETGRPPAKMEGDWPLYPAMFESLMAPHLDGWQYQSVELSEGRALPDPASLDAILITGSPAGVYDNTPWMAPLMDFIRWAADAQTPQIGICFGHQALAHALGAKVTKSDKGWGIGRHTYDVIASQTWMGAAPPDTFSLGVSHQDQVLSLPPGAVLVAQNAFCEFAALAYPSAKAISFQGHPEYSPAFSCALYNVRRGTRLPDEMVDQAEASFADPIDNDLIATWMARFLQSAAN